MQPPKVLLDQPNKRGTLQAIVEQDDRTAYLYIYPAEQFGDRYNMRACWLRNLLPAPEKRDAAAMSNGQAPLLEARFCRHPEGQAPLEADELRLMWDEEDDGATLFYQNEPLAIIPGWSLYSADEVAAYSRDCVAVAEQHALFPIQVPALLEKVERTAAFWHKWSDEQNNPWPAIQQQFLDAYEKQLGPSGKYYAIDQQDWPPMAMARFEKDDIVYFITLGVSIRPMPWVALLYNDKAPGFRRMELGLAVSKKDFTESEIMNMAQILSGIADSPWKTLTWLGEGHTIAAAALPAGYDSFILSSALYKGDPIDIPKMEGDTVNLYWASPITLQERESAHSKPNGGYALLEQLIGKGVTHVVRKR